MEFKIYSPNLNYKIKKHLYGATYEAHCWTTNPLDFKTVTVHLTNTHQKAQNFQNVFKKITNPSVCDEFYIGTCKNASTVVSRKEFTGDSLTSWIAIPKADWEYKKLGTWCIGLGADTKSVLRAILRGLQAIHNAGAYHGNIKTAVRISPQNEVMIATSMYGYPAALRQV